MAIETQRVLRQMRTVAVLLLLCCLSAAPLAWGGDVAGPLAIASPPDRVVVEGSLVNLALRISPNAIDELQVFVNNRRLRLPKKTYNFNACFDGIELAYGTNFIRVVGVKQGQKVAEAVSRVFFRSDLSSSASAAPDGWERYLFHSTREKGCVACHKLDFSSYSDEESSAERSPCSQCHKKLLSSYQRVHGPAAVWSCLSCHDKKATPKLSVQKPESKICFNCHEDAWSAMKFGHGPTAMGSCATCHDPHASDQRFFLRASPGDLCAGCHEEILQKPHVIMGFSNSGHPLRRNVDPYHPGRSFSCVSCHNPHAGNATFFLQDFKEGSDLSTFCRNCHTM